MTRRILLLAALLFFFTVQGRSQNDLQDPLGSAFRIAAQGRLRAALPPRSAAVLFSGGLMAQGPDGQFPLPFEADPDFYYLTGLRVPDAVVVVFAEPRTLTEGSVSTLIFLPDKSDRASAAMGYEYRGKFGLQEGGVAIRQAAQWGKFIQEILSGESVDRVFTKPVQLATYEKPGGEGYVELSYRMFSALAPGFPVEAASQRLYKDILAADTSSMSVLAQRVNAYLEYQTPPLRDPLLERFGRVTSLQTLREIQADIRRVKVDVLQYSCCLRAYRDAIDPAELELVERAAAILGEAMRATCARVAAGRTEARLQAVAEYVAAMRMATVPMRASVASGRHAAQPNYRAGLGTVPKAGLVVVDLAVAVDGYAARATRTVPVGSFGEELKPLYEGVLAIHQKTLSACQPNVTPSKLQSTATAGFDALDKTLIFSTNALGARKVLKVTAVAPMGLGLQDGSLATALKPGHVVCVETALYLPDEDGVTAKWRGTGVVLRDLVHIGEGGSVVLTKGIPLEAGAVQALVNSPFRLPED